MAPSSFGLDPTDASKIKAFKERYLSEVFDCVYSGGLTYEAATKLPVNLRAWWLRRVEKMKEFESKSQNVNPDTSADGRNIVRDNRR